MKIGYANLLSTYINAPEVDYDDCATFQIVCPACREAIFKVKRDTSKGALHYLSHYAASQAYQADCEHRVYGISSEQIQIENKQGRNQTLTFFLSVLYQAIEKSRYPGSSMRERLMPLHKSAGLRQLIKELYSLLRIPGNQLISDESLHKVFMLHLEQYRELRIQLRTGFMVAIQERIATDILNHLISATAGPNFTALFNQAYSMVLGRIELTKQHRPVDAGLEQLRAEMIGLVDKNKGSAMRQIERMKAMRTRMLDGTTLALHQRVIMEVFSEMTRTLFELDYFTMLKDAQQQAAQRKVQA